MTETLRFFPAISDIPAARWDALAGPQPCLRHAYLAALEDTGCVGPTTGWRPQHATLWDDDTLVAAMPLYEKQHSWGEYVFDWAWAEAYARHGLDYYPKWLSAIPFTPIPGRRLLGIDRSARARLLQQVLAWVEAGGHGSIHWLFPTEDDAALMRDCGLLLRHGVQFHWHNAGYADFEAFLAALTRDKRKKIRQERRRVVDAGITFEWRDGHALGAGDLAFFHHCYRLTYAQRRSTPYLSHDFFAALVHAQPASVRLLTASRDGTPVACAWFLVDESTLYGRYWGAVEAVSCLHFETCYYQAIDYAIRHGLTRFEGGAQGEHKLSRGLRSVPTCSAHWIRDPRFRDAIDDHLARERHGVALYLDELDERTPFRPAP
ncbi:MAG: N-acetyltransferase [Rhodocyclaceae bacterium]|nr:N-acetyltransferase [Rhodocyclaceae bacterium]